MKKYMKIIGSLLTLAMVFNFNIAKAQDKEDINLAGLTTGIENAIGGFDFENSPTLSETELTLKIGEKYDFDVNNKIEGSKYYYSSLNEKVSTITHYKGIVTGKEEGINTVYCKVTLPDGTIGFLKCKITVIK
jgi:hypothetical protein